MIDKIEKERKRERKRKGENMKERGIKNTQREYMLYRVSKNLPGICSASA